MLALPVEPLSKRGKGDIRDKRSYRGSSRGGWWRAKEDVTLDREHQDPEDGRPRRPMALIAFVRLRYMIIPPNRRSASRKRAITG